MDTSERKYSTCEREALAVIFALKTFLFTCFRSHLSSWLLITRRLVTPFARRKSTVVRLTG